jgi:hypothetical protein
MHARYASHGLQDTIVRTGVTSVPPEQSNRTPARRSLGEHDPYEHSVERSGSAQCSEYGQPGAAARARRPRRGKTRRGDQADLDLDDQCRLVAAEDVLAVGEHIPHAGNNQNPECRPGHSIERAGGHVCRLPTECPKRRHQGRKPELPADPDGCCHTWRNTRTVSQPTVSTDTSNQLKRNVPVAPAVGADGTYPTLSPGQSMAVAGSDAARAIERCGGEPGCAGRLADLKASV